jgi:glycosyltransferase involved in cell wall biosynthesis
LFFNALRFGTGFENTLAQMKMKIMNTIYTLKENQNPAFKIRTPENQSNPTLSRETTNPLKNTLKSNPVLTLETSFPMMNIEESNPMLTENPSNPKQNYAIIVPCYNEEKRFPYQAFLSFAQKHPEVLICFVNDGSKDKTLAVLKGIQSESPENICVYSLQQNGGKSEAVRQGMLYMHLNFKVELLGFLDADLATTPEEWLHMAKYKEQYPQFGAIVGSRIQRLGANINRDDSRSLVSSIIKKFIRVILKSSFQDTQCGAKIFHRNLVPFLFNKSFMTPWLFDVEIFLRLQKKFGRTSLQKGVLEFPLMHWTEVGDSRLKLKDTIKIPMQLLKLHYQYNFSKKFIMKSGYSLFDTKYSMPAISQFAKSIVALF